MITSICIVILVFCKDHRFQKSLLLRHERKISFSELIFKARKSQENLGLAKFKVIDFWQLIVVRRNSHHFYRKTEILYDFFSIILFCIGNSDHPYRQKR